MIKYNYYKHYQDWRTPQNLFDELNQEFNFVIDVAATEDNKKTERCYTPEEDGLSQSWDVGGAVWCNPPYKNIRAWVKKAYHEHQKGITVVMLIPASTDTTYFHDYILGKAEIRFLKGRLKFERDGSPLRAPFASMIVIWRGETQ